MKRSEMVNYIAGILSTHDKLSNQHPLEFVEYASYMLNMIEDAGMLPPYHGEGKSSYEIVMGADVNTWEPE